MYYIGCLTHIYRLTHIYHLSHLEQLIQAELKKTADYWWISACRENRIQPDILNSQLEVIRKYAIDVGQDLKKINLVVNTTVDIANIHSDFNIFSLDIFRAIVYYYKHYTDQKFSTQYNPCDKVLFLIGKPDKIHRTPLLIELIQRQLKSNLVYSWIPTEPGYKIFDRVQSTVQNSPYKNIDLINFCKTHSNILDVSEKSFTRDDKTNFHYNGFPFDCNLFNQTGISLVSETELGRLNLPIWLTEKIWKTVANNRPFILAGPPTSAEYMRTMGYETWDSFLLHEQDAVNAYWQSDSSKALEMIVDNVEFFIRNSYKNSKLDELTKYNSYLLDMHVQQDIKTIFKSIDTFKKFINLAKFNF